MRGVHWLWLFGGILAAWTALFLMAVPSELRSAERVYGADFIAALCAPGEDGWAVLRLSVMWLVMSAGMMLPTALPALATYDDLGHVTGTAFGKLIGGYLAVWGGYSLIAALVQVGLVRAGLLGLSGQSLSVWLSSALLLVAGAYQFTEMKDACLSKCRAPLTFFMQHWDEGPWRLGLRLGATCLGCCWALMALAFVGGVMNLGFMALAMVLMVLEKLPDIGQPLTRPLGGLMILAAVALPAAQLIQIGG
ncbi:MAG: DUF2182 domain-containing protein [Paracoccaceae bacterium]